MKPNHLFKICKTLFIVIGFALGAEAQNYNNIVNYNLNNTPVNGIKITTNLPFTSGTQMPTIFIRGYNYGGGNYGGVGAIDLTINYYIYDSGSGAQFLNYKVSTGGTYAPPIQLSNESGKVVIFINDKPYYPRFTISAFAQGMSQDGVAANYAGWTVTDAVVTGTNTVTVPYVNTFSGTMNLPGGGILNSSGALAIGTNNPYTYMLAVNGGAVATSMTVKAKANWPDYVFDNDYHLPSLNEVKTYIEQNKHLPEMPSVADVEKNGQDLGEMNRLLTKKVEELTLYLIENNRKQAEMDKVLKVEQKRINELEKKLKLLKKGNK
jgi:predicted XRE-type DNA-binding protein